MAGHPPAAARAALQQQAYFNLLRGTPIPTIAKSLNVSEKTIDRWIVEINKSLVERLPEDLEEIKAQFIQEQRAIMHDAWSRLQAIPNDADSKIVPGLQRTIHDCSVAIYKAMGGLSNRLEVGAGKSLTDLLHALTETPMVDDDVDVDDLGDVSQFEA